MSDEQKLQYLLKNSSYGASWDEKLRRMSSKQLHAVYMRTITKEREARKR